MNPCRHGWLLAACLGLASGAGLRAAEFDFAPLVARDTDVFGRARWRALGPLFERRTGPTGEVYWAARPLTSTVRDPVSDRCESDVVWPLWTRERMAREAFWSACVLMRGENYDLARAGGRYKFMVFPVYFQGRDAGGQGYLALFPLGGTIREFLGRDEIAFALFPLMMNSRVNEVVTRDWLWPVFSRTAGGGHERFRVFPVYGYTRFRLDIEKRFVLWPVWTSARSRTPGASGGGYILFPVMGHWTLADQETWMALPPLIRFSNGARTRDVHCPWPLFQWSKGPVNRLYFWPVWGRKAMEGNDSMFVAWPLYRQARRFSEREERTRAMLIPVLHATRERRLETDPDGGAAAWRTTAQTLKVWPLFSYAREGGRTRLRALSLFPFMDYEPVERNYAALWTFYEHTARGSVREDELLWGLARWRRSDSGERHVSLFPLVSVDRAADGTTSWSVLKGLVACERAGARRTVRLGYLWRW